jgi:CHAT domain-containing protein
MYATVRLPNLESPSASLIGAQAGEVPFKPTPDIQKLLDAAAKLPIPEQKAALERALEAALAAKDNEGVREAVRGIYVWFRSNRPQEVVSRFESLAANARFAMDRNLEALALNNLGNALRDHGDLDKALVASSESLAIRREILDKRGIADSLNNIALIIKGRGDLDKALLMHTESMAIRRELRDKSGVSMSLTNIATIHKNRGDLDKALSMLTESLAIDRELGVKSGIAISLNNIAGIHDARGDLDKALSMYTESLAICRELGDKSRIAQSLNNIADIHESRGDTNKALSMYTESLAMRRELGDKRGIVGSLNRIAGVHLTWSAYRGALLELSESESLCRVGGFKSLLAENRKLHSEILASVGSADLAAASLAEAGKLYAELDSPDGQSKVLVGDGDARFSNGDASAALVAYTRALELRTKATLAEGIAGGRIGEALLGLGRIPEAIVSLEGFIERNRAKGIVEGVARALGSLGRAQLRQNRQDNAKASFLGALSIAERTGDANEAANALRELSEIALRQGNVAAAILLAKRGIDARQSQRAGASALEDGMRTSLTGRLAPDYRRLADLLVVEGRVSESEQVLALLKESELRAAGAATERRATILLRSRAESDAEVAYLQASSETVALGARLRILELAKQPSKEVLDERADLLKRLEMAEKFFEKEMERIVTEARSSGSASRAEALQGSGDGISKSLLDLPEGTAALSMLWLDDRVRMIVTTPSVRVIRTSMVDARTLGKRILAFREVLTDPSKDPLPASWALYDLLWKPVSEDLRRLKVGHVMLSLDGPVRYIPLGALHDGSGYLAERLRLSLFSPTERDRITQRPSNRWDVLFAGVSNGRTVDDGLGSQVSFSNLPGVRDEARRVRAVLAGGPPTVLDGGFDLQSLRTGLLARPKVVHLASHFLLRSGSESESFLLTGKGDVLRISDSQTLSTSLFRSVELLTLSACQTGMTSETADGREVESIATVFQRKGASAVLSTLWPVADASTAAFMGTFYTLRAQDPRRTKAWCLREAQVRMIRGEVAPPGAPKPVATRGTTSIKVSAKGLRKDWSHPYHWAPFILQGNPL